MAKVTKAPARAGAKSKTSDVKKPAGSRAAAKAVKPAKKAASRSPARTVTGAKASTGTKAAATKAAGKAKAATGKGAAKDVAKDTAKATPRSAKPENKVGESKAAEKAVGKTVEKTSRKSSAKTAIKGAADASLESQATLGLAAGAGEAAGVETAGAGPTGKISDSKTPNGKTSVDHGTSGKAVKAAAAKAAEPAAQPADLLTIMTTGQRSEVTNDARVGRMTNETQAAPPSRSQPLTLPKAAASQVPPQAAAQPAARPASGEVLVKKQTSPAMPPKPHPRADIPPTAGFTLVVDGHFKNQYDDADAARTAGADLLRRFPMLRVEIYDAGQKTRTRI